MQLIRLLAGAALAGLVIPLTGCGSAVVGADGANRRSDAVVRAEMQWLYDSTWGSPRARQASEVLAYVAFHDSVAACLAQQGMAYTAGPFVDATVAQRLPLDWYDALLPADEAVASQSGFLRESKAAPEIRPSKKWPGSAPAAEAQMACEEQNAYVAPAALNPDLDKELYSLVGKAVEATPAASPKRYRDCMRAEGVTIDGKRSDFVQSYQEGRAAGGQAGAVELYAAAADARCRREAHVEVMAKLDQPLKEFASKHAARLAESPTVADSLQARAQKAAADMGLVLDWL